MYGVNSLIITAIVFPFLGVIAVALRFYVRLRLQPTSVGIDDWMIALSCLLVCAQGVNQIIAAKIGQLGRDGSPQEPQRVKVQSRDDTAILIVECFTYSFIKISVLMFYRRIFTTPNFRLINNILIILIASWAVAFLLARAFTCGLDSQGGHPCPSAVWSGLWFAITDVIGDIAVLAMPYPMVRKLQISKRDKVGVCGLFLLGTLSVVAGIVRLGFVAKTFSVYFHPSDSKASAQRTPPSFWTTVEVSLGVLAACLPALAPLIKRVPSSCMHRRSSKAASRDEHAKIAHNSKTGWINLPDRNISGGMSYNTTDGNGKPQGTHVSVNM